MVINNEILVMCNINNINNVILMKIMKIIIM